jgi:hypothetical protein
VGPGLPPLEALLASMAKRGADEMADRHLIENREAAVGVQMFHMRQRWGAAVCWRAQTQVLLGRLKCALPGWEEAEVRAMQRSRRRRPVGVGGHTPVGLATVGGLAEIAAGVLGTAATWVARPCVR